MRRLKFDGRPTHAFASSHALEHKSYVVGFRSGDLACAIPPEVIRVLESVSRGFAGERSLSHTRTSFIRGLGMSYMRICTI